MSVHRGAGRVDNLRTSDLIREAATAKSGNDSVTTNGKGSKRPGAKRVYVTRAEVDSIRERLNRRQRAILEDVERLGVATGRQIQRAHYSESSASSRRARAELAELVSLRVLSRLGRSVGGVRAGSSGWTYALGVAGQRLLDPDRSYFRRPWTPGPSHLRHALAVSELYVRLRELERESDMQIASFQTEPACWRGFSGPGGSRAILKPDAFAVIHLGDFEDRLLIEQDMGTEASGRITAKAKTYIRYWQTGKEQARTGVFPLVLWITPDSQRSAVLVDALASFPAEHWPLFMVTTAALAPNQIASGIVENINPKGGTDEDSNS